MCSLWVYFSKIPTNCLSKFEVYFIRAASKRLLAFQKNFMADWVLIVRLWWHYKNSGYIHQQKFHLCERNIVQFSRSQSWNWTEKWTIVCFHGCYSSHHIGDLRFCAIRTSSLGPLCERVCVWVCMCVPVCAHWRDESPASRLHTRLASIYW